MTTVSTVLKGFNGTPMNASLSLGAGRIETFWRITLPMILPGVLSGALFAFATSFDEVVVPRAADYPFLWRFKMHD